MIKINKKSQCCGCGACYNVCPKHAIIMRTDIEGFEYPVIDNELCIDCHLCEIVCPWQNHNETSPPKFAYAAMSFDKEIRYISSSGGLFYVLANNILRKKGVVYGVCMDDGCDNAVYLRVDDLNQIDKLTGSKYIQSRTGTVYTSVKGDLDTGKYVLFTGTPCQVNALKLFLRKEYEKLICVDIICHGVPSPMVWEIYKDSVQKRWNDNIRSVSFRSKKFGWSDFGIEEEIGGKKLFTSKELDPYMQLFLKNISLRPSCYNCNAKECRRADITFGDFWGVSKVLPGVFDDTGVSLVIPRTEKGNAFYDSISNNVKSIEVDYNIAVMSNSAEIVSVCEPPERSAFFDDLASKIDFYVIVRKYAKPNYKKYYLRKFFASKLWALINRVRKSI